MKLRTESSTVRPYLLLTLILLFCLSSCSKNSELQMEAREKAEQWFEKTVIKCRDDYFVKVTYGLLGDRVNGFYQLKNPAPTVEETKRNYTEADKLNSEVYDWDGIIYVYSTHYRHYYYGWSPWQEGTPTYNPIPELTSESPPLIRHSLHRKNGKWNVDAETESKFDCSNLPE